jgi:hypothetical protein
MTYDSLSTHDLVRLTLLSAMVTGRPEVQVHKVLTAAEGLTVAFMEDLEPTAEVALEVPKPKKTPKKAA